MPLLKSAPVDQPVFNKDGTFTPSWNLWFEAVDSRLASVEGGGASGDVLGDVNTGFDIDATGDIYINGLKLEYPENEGDVAITTSTELTWTSPDDLAATPVGTIRVLTATPIQSGWVLLDDGTIGSSSSGASNRANADTEDLYTQIWNGVSDTYAPVSSGRGASAAADFAANKTIQLGKFAGRALRIMAGTGTLGVTNGAETAAMAENQVPEHSHTFSAMNLDGAGFPVTSPVVDEPRTPPFESEPRYTSQYAASLALNDDEWMMQKVGSGTAQDILQETVFFKYMIKL